MPSCPASHPENEAQHPNPLAVPIMHLRRTSDAIGSRKKYANASACRSRQRRSQRPPFRIQWYFYDSRFFELPVYANDQKHDQNRYGRDRRGDQGDCRPGVIGPEIGPNP